MKPGQKEKEKDVIGEIPIDPTLEMPKDEERKMEEFLAEDNGKNEPEPVMSDKVKPSKKQKIAKNIAIGVAIFFFAIIVLGVIATLLGGDNDGLKDSLVAKNNTSPVIQPVTQPVSQVANFPENEIRPSFISNDGKVATYTDVELMVNDAMHKVSQDFRDTMGENNLELRLMIEKNKDTLARLEQRLGSYASKEDLAIISSEIENTLLRIKKDEKEIELLKQLTADLSKDVKLIKDMPINAVRKNHAKTTKEKKKPKIRYKLASAMDGRAWVVSRRDGGFVLLEEGDNLLGYGQILKITSDGRIHTVSGEVLLVKD